MVHSEFGAQLSARPVKHHAEIARRNVQSLANFLVRALLDGIKLKNLADPRWQFAHCPFQMRAELAEFKTAARGQGFGGDLMNPKQGLVERPAVVVGRKWIKPHGAFAAGFPQVIANLVA